jgi:quinoprotein glucose dehydrogenase
MKIRPLSPLCCLAFYGTAALAGDDRQVEIAKQGGFVPKIQEASDEGLKAIKQFKLADGLNIDLWAAEPLLANPVAIATDEKGRWFVAETFRLHAGVSDIRAHMGWLEDELASTNLDSWLAILKGDPSVDFEKNAKNSERVQLVWDSKGSGKADSSKIFAEGFNEPLSGIGSGVLSRKGSVYFTNIPDLWLLKDTKQAGTADVKQSLARGFGVRTAFLGHDMHGLRIGPDGRLYFTIGDRGANATAIDGSRVTNTETGAVYRCNLDGSGLEIFAVGLRNPQELAFDKFGNLFTGDNNSDAGDPARWVYVMQNSDSGWRIGWQFLTKPEARGPWLSERLCYPAFRGQAAYHLPPIAVLGNGPSGLTYHPGTGLSPQWKDHFFLANFSGSPSNSGILSVTVIPKGAGFDMSPVEKPIWNILATDVEFGVDGALYLADWVNGWGMNGKGRIYKMSATGGGAESLLAETQKLIGEGMEKRNSNELMKLLAHEDMRVRQEAQFELASRRDTGVLEAVAAANPSQLARLHAIWGLGQVARQTSREGTVLVGLLKDADLEVRAQAAKTLGDLKTVSEKTSASLVALLADESARVRSFAAIALGNTKTRSAVPALLEALGANKEGDAALRHALSAGLAGCALPETLIAAQSNPSVSVRLGAVVALRRLKHEGLAKFLEDAETLVVAEAARAIHDESVDAAMPALAALIAKAPAIAAFAEGTKEQPGPRDAILRRVVNANYRVGQASSAEALARLASAAVVPVNFRIQALQQLGVWENPPRLDRVMGLHRPLPKRESTVAVAALRPVLSALLSDTTAPSALRLEVLNLVEKFVFKGTALDLAAVVSNEKEDAAVRAKALVAMAARADEALVSSVNFAATANAEALRKEATRLRVELHLPGGGVEALAKVLEIGTTGEKQNILTTFGTMADPAAAAVLEQYLDRLLAGKLPTELHLEVMEAAAKRSEEGVKARLAKVQASYSPTEPLAAYRFALAGGNAADGRKVFMEKAEASCIRCHKVNNDGAEVGPVLTGVGKRQTREYLLESIVDPNAKIAAGFETVIVTLQDGSLHAGILKGESETELSLMQPTGVLEKLSKAQIKSRERGPSGMPALAAILSKKDVRDLVEYLASLK